MSQKLILLVLLCVATPAFAAIDYEVVGETYSQNFNSLPGGPNSTGNSWVNDVTIPGWWSNDPIYIQSSGNITTGSLHAFSTGAAGPDRALGSIASDATGTIHFGVGFRNTTGQTLTSFTLSYTGEQWRRNGNLNVHSLTFEYSTGTTFTSTYTPVPVLDFDSPTVGNPGASINGNAEDNRTPIGPYTVTGINWAPGTHLWLRWSDINDTGNDHALAIDDLSFSAQAASVPEPASISIFGVGLGMLGIGFLRRRRSSTP